MTVPRFGRITPMQWHVLNLIGYTIGRGHVGLDIPEDERLANMRDGREALVGATGQDLGYDLAAWHDYLRTRPDTGYTHPYGYSGVRRAVEEALNEPERLRLVQRLGAEGGD
jgi:hypothetical protein